MVKLYHTLVGAVIEDNSGAKSLWRGCDWDDLINRDDLHSHCLAVMERLPNLSESEFASLKLLPPLKSQEIWAAGVTYKRSQEARTEESGGARSDDPYARVYAAERPELFFKALAHRTTGHWGTVTIRDDSNWNVPEPELALFISSSGKIVGYTCGNDMSSRSIEGENPLYLPQAKTWDGSAGLGPCIYVRDPKDGLMPPSTAIKMEIFRGGRSVFADGTTLANLKRGLDELASWLFRASTFAHGAFLMTGTCVVPPNDFTLFPQDEVHISIDNIGTMVNVVEAQRSKGGDAAQLEGRGMIGYALGGAVVKPFGNTSDADVDHACELAHAAAASYGAVSAQRRAAFLDRCAREIEAIGDPLIQCCAKETNLASGRVTNERGRTCDQLRMFARLLRDGSWVDARLDVDVSAGKDLRRMLVALGPIVVFGASNFPLAFSAAGGDTASALAAGCPVVVKAHSAHPRTSELVGRAVLRAARACALPEGVYSMVHGRVGERLVAHPAMKAVGLTGSFGGGMALSKVAASRPEPIPVFAEMGSVNPVFVLPEMIRGAGAAKVAAELAGSITLGAGQFCTNPGAILLVDGPDSQVFIKELSDRIAATPTAAMLTPSIRDSYRDGVTHMLKLGAKAIANGAGPEDPARPCLLTAPASALLSEPKLAEEVFGPCSCVYLAKSKEMMLECASKFSGQLCGTIWATDGDLAAHPSLVAIVSSKVGRVVFNSVPTGVVVCDAQQHGGPFPASTDARFTSVGTAAIYRWVRPVCWQNLPAALHPQELRDDNPLGIVRIVNGVATTSGLGEPTSERSRL